MSKVTDFVERVKTERDAQILVAGILFFTIAFPVAFASAASGVESAGLSAVGDYVVNGEVETILLEEGGEYIQDGDEWPSAKRLTRSGTKSQRPAATSSAFESPSPMARTKQRAEPRVVSSEVVPLLTRSPRPLNTTR